MNRRTSKDFLTEETKKQRKEDMQGVADNKQ